MGYWTDLMSRPIQEDPPRICYCVGPQNGDPACPCMMAARDRRKVADMALAAKARLKPRVRVKCGRQIHVS